MKCPYCKKDFEKGVEAAYQLGLLSRDSTRLITESIHHKTLNGTELVKQREDLGMNQAEFAERCGWSRPYQCQLESPELHEITTDTAMKIITVFEECK